jgi:hypothetical protein
MTMRSIVCPECGADVPYGRLSCAACGTLLASVAGAPPRTLTVSGGSSEAAPEESSMGPEDSSMASDTAAEAPSILSDWTGPTPSVAAPMPGETWAIASRGPGSPSDGSSSEPARAATTAGEAPIAGGYLPPNAAPLAGPSPSVGGSVKPAPAASGTSATAVANPPGPGSTATDAAELSVAASGPAVTVTAAREPGPRVPSVAPTPRPQGWFSTRTIPGQVPAPVPAPATTAGLFSDLPFRAPDEVGGRAVAVGAGLAAVAFVLPWARNGVVGGVAGGDYLGRWGLANPSYLILVAAALATLLATILPNRLPLDVRAIGLPFVVGGLLLGVGWTYASSAYGTGLGVDTMSIGAIAMVAGAVLELRRARHASDMPPAGAVTRP